MTLVDVAREAGCSVSLASIVFRDAPGASDATRARVRAAAERIGYRPDSRARWLRRAQSGLIGVVFNVRQQFHAGLIEGLYQAAETMPDIDLALAAVYPGRDDARAAEGLLRERCEALIMIGPFIPTGRIARLAQEVPVVVVARKLRAPSVDQVRVDDRRGCALAVDHLVSLGHTRIAHVDGGEAPGSADRRRGYLDRMRTHGLEQFVDVIGGGATAHDGAVAGRALLDREPRPSAVAVFNDLAAIGLMNWLGFHGVRAPEAVSITGFDDTAEAAGATVPLTSVSQELELMTSTALTRAVDRARGRCAPGELVIEPRLVVRDSCARYGGSGE